MADVYSKAKRSEIMSRVKNKKTSPENAVAQLLRELGIKYRRNVSSLPGSPDFAVKSAKTAIFVHGCFWHGHDNCSRGKSSSSNVKFWKNKINTNKRRDARAAANLRILGWHVMTIWACKLRKPDKVKNRLAKLSK